MSKAEDILKEVESREENEPEQPKPELEPEMAQWLLRILDCELPLKGHKDRNNMQVVSEKLVAIANWNEKDVT